MEFQETSRTKIIFQNIFIVFFILVIAISAISYFFSRFYFNELIKEKLIENFNTANASKYELTIESLNTNLLRGYILIKNVEIKRTKNYSSHKYLFIEDINIPIVEIKQVSLFDLINHNHLDISFFLVQNSVTNFVFNKDPKNRDSLETVMDSLENKNFIGDVDIDVFNINNANINIKNALSDSVVFSAEGFNIELKSMKMNTVLDDYIKKLDNINNVNSLISTFQK